MSDIAIFDRSILRQRRQRAAANFSAHDFLFKAVFGQLLDHLEDVQRDFPLALCLNPRLENECQALITHPKIGQVVAGTTFDGTTTHPLSVTLDEEILPFAEHSFDLVVSNLSLQTINDVPGTLIQLQRCLKPDGLFLASLFGDETLHELRISLMEAELERRGGISPRTAPQTTVQDVGMLLQRAGFALPVVDSQRLTATYPDIWKLMQDLRGMGETNVVKARPKGLTTPGLFQDAEALYRKRFSNPDGTLNATFDVLTISAWAPADSQPKALKPGSATTRLASALDTEEKSAGEKAGL